jgi:hypothetical protein
MLSGMTSLALLAHTAHATTPAFNGLFYATVATVIPVLFLAIAVQSRTYDSLVKVITYDGPDARLFAISLIAIVIAELILASGAIGEVSAVKALMVEQAGHTSQVFVFYATAFLIVAAVRAQPGRS